MFPPPFEYFRAESQEQVLDLLARHGAEGKILAGGLSLIPLMKLRLASPAVLIDINRIPELQTIAADDRGGIRIGAMTRHHQMEKGHWPASLALLADAAGVIGDPQVRNLGTVGGALAEVDPAGDWGPVMLSLQARVLAVSSRGERTLPVEELFVDAYTTCLREDELLREVEIPPLPEGTGTAYLKMERKAGDFAIASAAVRVSRTAEGRCRDVGIGLGGVGLVPLRARRAEELLLGSNLDEPTIQEAQESVRSECEPLPDIRGSAEFKRQVASVLFRRALGIAVRRAQGEKVEAGHV